MGEVEMFKAVWGSEPRFSDGINFRFVRSEGRAFPKRRCLIPASEFRMGTGDHRYRVTLDSGNFFYLAAVWDPPLADWPLSYRIQIGRAHVCTQVTNAHLVCRLLLDKKKTTSTKL